MAQAQNELVVEFLNGKIDRRTLIRRAAAAGMATSTLVALLRTNIQRAGAQGTPAASPAATAAAVTGSEMRPDAPPAPDDQQVLRLASAAPFRMDPPTHSASLWALQNVVFSPLARIGVGNALEPGVADSWEANPELTSWTFKLNPNAKFSDGSPITADDVKWSWEWLANPASKSVGPERVAGTIVGYADVLAGTATTLEGIVVVDPQTVTFNLTSTDPVFGAKAGVYSTSILQRANVESGGEEWWRTPVTSGMLKVTEYTPGDAGTMTLERNEHWWREPAKLARVQYQVIPEAQTQLVMYDDGQLDTVVCPPAEFAQAVQEGGPRHEELVWQLVDSTFYFGFFIEKPPFDDVKVRQAFAHAVDRQVLADAVLGGLYQPQKRMLSPTFMCSDDSTFQPEFDVAMAQQRLTESTYGGPDNLPPVTILVSEPGGSSAPGIWGRMAQAIQQQLQENLGVQVEVIRKVYGTLAEQQTEARAIEGGVIFRLSIGVSIQDPSYFLGLAQSGPNNAMQYNNPAVDELIVQASSETDETRRCEIFNEIDRTISEEAIFLAPFRGSTAAFFKPRVRGINVILGSFDSSVSHIYIAAE